MSNKLIDMFREQMMLEDATVEALTPLAEETKNSIFKMFLKRLILDSMKHSDILKALIELNTDVEISEVDKKTMKEALNKHIASEEKMLYRIQEIMNEVRDEKTLQMIREIVNDEKRHHDILNELLKMIEGIESIRKEDWWGLIYDRSEWLF